MQQPLPLRQPFKLCRSSSQTPGSILDSLSFSYSMFSTTSSPKNISRLTLDILQLVMDCLDTHSLAELSRVSRLFHSLVRRELNFEAARWCQQHHTRSARNDSFSVFPMSGHDDEEYESNYVDNPVEIPLILPPPIYHQRCMARIGDRLFMPFMTMEPVCFIYDIPLGSWQRQPLQPYPGYTPFVTPVVAIGSRIYMFGGRQVITATLSNNVTVLDTETWALQPIELMRGPVPRPRHDHTLDALKSRFVVVFGGACTNSPGENDLHLFDTHTNTWIEPRQQGQIPPICFGHASIVLSNDLYVFGGCQLQLEENMVHDVLYRLDTETWTWYKYDHPEAYRYRRNGAMRSMPGEEPTDIADSLRRDLILETTGYPPRDRFYCTMQSIGSHKLLIFGGQTVRQDRDDNNILHAHSLRSIDVFNVRRKHWSAIPTTSYDGEHNAYPQDLTCFPLNNQQQDGHKLLLIGQQKSFTGQTTDSSGESSADVFTGPASGGSFAMMPQPQPLQMHGNDQDTNLASSSTPQLPTRALPSQLLHSRTSPANMQSLARAPLVHHQHPSTLGLVAEEDHQHPLDRPHQRRALSRHVADYEGFLESIVPYEEVTHRAYPASLYSGSSGDSLSHSASSPIHDPAFSSVRTNATNASNSSSSANQFSIGEQSGTRHHYSIEPLYMILTLDQE